MLVVDSFGIAIVLLVVNMLCWGSWANTLKLASREWRFPLYYWDYCIGMVLTALVVGLTFGSFGSVGRSFIADLGQADGSALRSAFIGGVAFNAANLLLVAAIDIAGMSVAFPVGIGLALVVGVVTLYVQDPSGNPMLLFVGVALVAAAILVDALAYSKLPSAKAVTWKGLVLSVFAGVLMGTFVPFLTASMAKSFKAPEAGLMTPYSAMLLCSLGVLASSFVFNSVFMYRPVSGQPVTYRDYFSRGTPWIHFVGILGGLIWTVGTLINLNAQQAVSPAVSYGLGQGATMVAAAWGVFVWKEFKDAPKGTMPLVAAMFVLFLLGLSLLIAARVA